MISDVHGLLNVVHWLQVFKSSYAQVNSTYFLVNIREIHAWFRSLLAGGFQVNVLYSAIVRKSFFTVVLQVWNNETMEDFLHRGYQPVMDNAINDDEEETIIHACL